MTAAVGSAAAGGIETLVQSGSGKVAAGARHAHVKQSDSDDSHSQSDETSQTPSRGEIGVSEADVDKTQKTSNRKHERRNSDKDGSSFEDAFASIGKDEPKEGSAIGSQANLPAMAAQMRVNSLPVDKSDVTDTPKVIQNAVAPRPLLQQKSILALMDARDRLLADARVTKSDAVSDSAVDSQFPARSDDTTQVMLMTVDGQETHWNFNADPKSKVDAQMSALDADGGKSSHATSLLGTASASSLKGKDQTLETNSPTDARGEVAVQATVSSEGDQLANSFLADSGKENQSGTQSQSQAAPSVTIERGSDNTKSLSALDQIFKENAQPQNMSGATQQVRDGVINSLASSKIDSTANASAVDAASRPTPAPVVRTLDLTLSPADLGAVKLRLSLKENSLSIEAEASKASTAKLLTDDRSNLERGLKDAGYDVSAVKITDASSSTSANASGSQSNGFPSRDADQSRSGFAGRQDGGMQRRDESMSDQSQRRPRQDSSQTSPADAKSGRLGNAVYI